MGTTQRQMLLDLKPEQVPSLDNFVAGANVELVERLRGLADARSFEAIYLWGGQGCGKSHLLTATAESARALRPVVRLAGAEAGAELQLAPGCLLVIDDVGQLGVEATVALFRAFNAARFIGLAMLLSGDEPPLRLALREDLRTRIGQTLIYEIHALSDEEKAAALRRHAIERGMLMDPSVVHYLLRHGRRDLPSLMAMLGSLDRASLEQKRPPTLPLLRELMQTSFDLEKE
ncbi:DnaA regulatory inactivator Hda [Sulfuritalea sp.]|uniref:DnaA regulatory inactivator Hda n=1 Tax=Sulfuritalea sp. TaxID=2480090 RepID=UPI001AC8490C|nr:DnaA regulatory inactivator Hda [Sulfuritalea sp.]MBN8476976.1 DnaA regulatory inactivator Hda [Sulfuritalea sp.]